MHLFSSIPKSSNILNILFLTSTSNCIVPTTFLYISSNCLVIVSYCSNSLFSFNVIIASVRNISIILIFSYLSFCCCSLCFGIFPSNSGIICKIFFPSSSIWVVVLVSDINFLFSFSWISLSCFSISSKILSISLGISITFSYCFMFSPCFLTSILFIMKFTILSNLYGLYNSFPLLSFCFFHQSSKLYPFLLILYCNTDGTKFGAISSPPWHNGTICSADRLLFAFVLFTFPKLSKTSPDKAHL